MDLQLVLCITILLLLLACNKIALKLVHEVQYILQLIVIDLNIISKKLVFVILLHFSVALGQNTTGVTTATTHPK